MSKKYQDYIGKVLDRRYKILDLVGEGGMAVVLKAEDLIMSRLVAIKILNPDYNGDDAMVQRFLNESKAVAMLSHKDIVSIYDVAIYDDMKYIVMEFLDGITLKKYIDSKGVLFWKEACFYAIQILKALEHAHSKGVIHRDIKPQNIMLQKSGEIKVTDFGIAKLPNASSLTVAEKAIGTVYYISPEQASGKKTDFHADLYSVGIMLYEMCTGRLPFVHENAINVAMMQVNDPPVEPIKVNSAIPEGLNQIILRAMEKDPGARFSSAHSMLKALEVLYNNPDVVFTSDSIEAAVLPGAVNIDRIATASIGEIIPYEGVDASVFTAEKIDEEVKEPLPEKKKKKRNKTRPKDGEKRKRSLFTSASHSMFPIVAGVFCSFIIVLLAVISVLFERYVEGFIKGETDTVVVEIPDLVGEFYNEGLVATLEGMNIKLDVDSDIIYENSGKPKDQIITQSHTGAVNMPKGQKYYTGLELHLSRGPDESVYSDLRKYSKGYGLEMFSRWGIDTSDIITVNVSDEDGSLPAGISKNDLVYASSSQILLVEKLTSDGEYVALEDGDTVREGDKIKMYVYAPDVDIEVPDLYGMELEEVERILLELGLTLGEVTVVESELDDDLVCGQSPESETLVTRGSVVNIEISDKCKFLPDIIGLSINRAKLALASVDDPDNAIYNCKWEYVYTDEEEDGTVIDVTLEGGTALYPGDPIYSTDVVVVTVAKHPEEEGSEDSSDINSAEDE